MTFVDGVSVDVQYSNWEDGHPEIKKDRDCVVVTKDNEWKTKSCDDLKRYVCQSQ